MIPKSIHYCWFGRGPKPKLAQRCIQSWQKYCPDYKITEWNEDNFDIAMNPYTKWCYENKKYAFLSDYVRLYVIFNYGGIYFDTDVELIRNLDFLLVDNAYFGFEINGSSHNASNSMGVVASGLGFGSIQYGNALKLMLDEYDPYLDGLHGVCMCPKLNTAALVKLGLKAGCAYQKTDDFTVYPAEYFNPLESTTGTLNLTKNTVSIHWYMGSCLSWKQKVRSKISKPLHRLIRKRN